MKDSKLSEVLRSFSKEEFREFEKFVASPFFSTGRDLIPLFSALKKYYPGFDHKNFTRQNIYKKIYPGEYNDKIMKPLLSNLLKMCEEYLKQITLRNYPALTHSLLAKETAMRNLNSITEKNITLAESSAEDYGLDDEYFRMQLDIQQSKIDYNLCRDRQILVCDDVKEHAGYIIYYFLASISKSLHNLEANRVTFNANFENHVIVKFLNNFNLENFLTQLNTPKLKNDLLDNNKHSHEVQIYSLITLTYRYIEKKEYFLRLKEMIYENIDKFRREEQYTLLNILIALCSLRRIKYNNKEDSREYFDLVKFVFSKKLYKPTDRDNFTVISFRTFFMNVLQMGEFEWVDKYVDKYIHEVAPEYRENLKLLCKSQIDFAMGRFDDALDKAGKIDFHVFIFKYDVKHLILKIYYEKGFFEEALYGVDSYLHFLSGNKNISAIINFKCSNFIKSYKKIILCKNGESDLAPVLLRNEVSKMISVFEKRWLLEKIDELENSQ